MKRKRKNTMLWVVGGLAALYFLQKSKSAPSANQVPVAPATPTKSATQNNESIAACEFHVAI